MTKLTVKIEEKVGILVNEALTNLVGVFDNIPIDSTRPIIYFRKIFEVDNKPTILLFSISRRKVVSSLKSSFEIIKLDPSKTNCSAEDGCYFTTVVPSSWEVMFLIDPSVAVVKDFEESLKTTRNLNTIRL